MLSNELDCKQSITFLKKCIAFGKQNIQKIFLLMQVIRTSLGLYVVQMFKNIGLSKNNILTLPSYIKWKESRNLPIPKSRPFLGVNLRPFETGELYLGKSLKTFRCPRQWRVVPAVHFCHRFKGTVQRNGRGTLLYIF